MASSAATKDLGERPNTSVAMLNSVSCSASPWKYFSPMWASSLPERVWRPSSSVRRSSSARSSSEPFISSQSGPLRPMASSKNKLTRPAMRGDYSAPALEKGMDIIELLADAETGLTVSEISERLKRGMNELFRVIVVMERRGWLRKDPVSSRYTVSYHLLLLAHRGTPAQTLTEAAAPVMQELSTRIDQSCHLVIRSGHQGLVIFRQENQRRYANLSVRMGGVLNLATSCSGLMLLAHMEDEAREALLKSLPRQKTS